MSEADCAELVTAAHQQLKASVILCWDNLNTHVSAVMRTFTGAHPGLADIVQMPAYAPDLNPVALTPKPQGTHDSPVSTSMPNPGG